jgi:hypothetical protein
MDDHKVKAILNWKPPRLVFALRSFLGLASYYCKFIKDFIKIATPFDQPFEKLIRNLWMGWNMQWVFETLKGILVKAPMFKSPNFDKDFEIHSCHDPSFTFMTKARACKGTGWEWSPWITFYVLGSVGCEGMNPWIPKCAPTLGVWVPMDSWIFKEQLQGSNLIGIKGFLYHWKSFRTHMFKMNSHVQFEYLKHKLWPKEGLKINYQFDFRSLKVGN